MDNYSYNNTYNNNPYGYAINNPYGNQFSNQYGKSTNQNYIPTQATYQAQPQQSIQQAIPQNYTQQSASSTAPQQNLLNGKIVESEDIVKITEIAPGSFSVFPTCDMSKIYVKVWEQGKKPEIITYDISSNENDKETTSTYVNDMLDSISKDIVNLSNEITIINEKISSLVD